MIPDVLDPHYFTAHLHGFFAHGKEKRSFPLSFVSALAFHAVLLFLGGMAFVKPPEYGIDWGRGGMEVYLVAGPANPVSEKRPPRPSSEATKSEAEKNPAAEMSIPRIEKTQESRPGKAIQRESAILKGKNSRHWGDGSSPSAGADAAAFYSPGGAWTEAAEAGHLRNPAPAYPQAAIELGQEGLVMLSAWVNQEGLPARIEIKKSSGFSLLDKSALNTIKKWKFSPGRIGLLPQAAWVTIPVRFRLEDVKQPD